MLTQDRLQELLSYNPDSGLFTWLVPVSRRIKVGGIAGSPSSGGYVRIHIDGKKYKAHRLAWLYTSGKWPAECIDHINGIRNDNRMLNLREATNSENKQNLRVANVNNKTGLLGVSYRKSGKFIARITINGARIDIGNFNNAEEAHQAYLRKKQELHPFQTLVK